MAKSLGDYNISQSSSEGLEKIRWTQKNSESVKKKKKRKNTSPTNIIYGKSKETKKPRTFKIHKSKSPKKKIASKVENSALSNCNIEQGFRRPGR